MEVEIRVHEYWPVHGLNVVLFRGWTKERQEYLGTLEGGYHLWHEYEQVEGGKIDPPFVLSMQNAQRLADDLWAAGIRPTEGIGSAGSLMATQQHLKDMRRIVFGKLGMEEPQVK